MNTTIINQVHAALRKLDVTRVIVVPHIAYYVLVAAQFQYRYAAGVVAVIMVAEVFYGHHQGADNETSHHTNP